MLRSSPNHGTQRLPNDDDDDDLRLSDFKNARKTIVDFHSCSHK